MHGTLQILDTSRHAPRERPTRSEAEEAVRTLIRWAGEAPSREGLADTPARVVRAYEEWFAGYEHDPTEILKRTFEQASRPRISSQARAGGSRYWKEIDSAPQQPGSQPHSW